MHPHLFMFGNSLKMGDKTSSLKNGKENVK